MNDQVVTTVVLPDPEGEGNNLDLAKGQNGCLQFPNQKDLDKLNKSIIRYPQINKLKEKIVDCESFSHKCLEPQCMALKGEPGAGKTTLLLNYVAAHPRYDDKDGTVIPVLYIETPSPATEKALALKISEELGDPAYSCHRTLNDLTRSLPKMIKACKVSLVILDDFHHLIDAKTDRVLNKVADWLKVMIKESEVPFVVVGVGEKIDRILAKNEQLSRLFLYSEAIQPFYFDLNDAIKVKELSAFVLLIEKSIGMRFTRQVSWIDLLHRLWYATNGYVGNMMNLSRLAAHLAGKANGNDIDLEALRLAFDLRLKRHIGKLNPFDDNIWKQITPPVLPPIDDPESIGKRSNPRKPRSK